jgi:NAD(P)-dependent dehydrogenase (short-subunit alcohol dehydrogenase family)
MTNQSIFLVTGATDGIGRATALTLAKRGARVLVHGRSRAKAEAARDDLRAEAKSESVEAAWADLSSLDEVRALAADVSERVPHLDVLLNNAGVFMNERALSRDGFEMTFAVNHLAPFLLTHLLLPKLHASSEPRIVNVSSVAHNRGVLDLEDPNFTRGFSGYGAYAASKLMNVLFSFDLARRLRSPFVAVNALHPGVIGTKLLREGFGMSGGGVDTGTRTSLRVATDPALARVTGKYFSDEREVAASRTAGDRALQERLYDLGVRLTGVTPLPAG